MDNNNGIRDNSAEDKLSFFNRNFWDQFLMKCFRNVASVKYQWLLMLYIPVILGMFSGEWRDGVWVAKIPPTLGLSFLGGGFVTLAISRIIANTTLNTKEEHEFNTDR